MRTLADGNRKICTVATRPSDVDAATAAEATASTDISGRLLYPVTLGPSEPDTIPDKDITQQGNVQVPGKSNFNNNSLVFIREWDSTDGQPDATADADFQAYKAKSTLIRILDRHSYKKSGEAWAAGDEYRYYEFYTGDPIDESVDGWIKFRVPLMFAGVYSLDQVVVA